MKNSTQTIIDRISNLPTVKAKVAAIKSHFEIEYSDNTMDNVVVLCGRTHNFYVSRTPLHEATRGLYYAGTSVDFISEDFSIAITNKTENQ
jgi:hypothetical protein